MSERHQLIDRCATAVNRLSRFCESLAGWLTLALVLVTAEQVIARYLFDASSIGMQELEWHLFGSLFMLALASTLAHDEHVRVDIVYGRLTPGQQRWINTVGYLVFLLPTCLVLIFYGAAFVTQARSYGTHNVDAGLWEWLLAGERSPDPDGLPARWLIKAMIPLGASLLLLQGTALVAQAWLAPKEEPDAPR